MHKTAKRVETRKLMRRKSLPKIHKTKLKGRKQVQEAVLNDPFKNGVSFNYANATRIEELDIF